MSQVAVPAVGAQPAFGITFFTTPDGMPSMLFDALAALSRGMGQPQDPPKDPPVRAVAGAAAQGGEPDGEQEKRQPLPRGEAERRALALLEAHPGEEFTPGRVAREIDARGCRDLMARLHARGVVEMVNEHPLTYRAAKPKRTRKKSQPQQ